MRVLCKECREAYPAKVSELEELGISPERVEVRNRRKDNAASRYFPKTVREPDVLDSYPDLSRLTFYRPKGCDKCAQTGFSGRRGIYELLLMDDAVGPLVLRNADAQTIKRTAIDFGMDSLRDDGARKVISGLTSVEEVLAATQEDQGAVEPERPASMRNVRV